MVPCRQWGDAERLQTEANPDSVCNCKDCSVPACRGRIEVGRRSVMWEVTLMQCSFPVHSQESYLRSRTLPQNRKADSTNSNQTTQFIKSTQNTWWEARRKKWSTVTQLRWCASRWKHRASRVHMPSSPTPTHVSLPHWWGDDDNQRGPLSKGQQREGTQDQNHTCSILGAQGQWPGPSWSFPNSPPHSFLFYLQFLGGA